VKPQRDHDRETKYFFGQIYKQLYNQALIRIIIEESLLRQREDAQALEEDSSDTVYDTLEETVESAVIDTVEYTVKNAVKGTVKDTVEETVEDTVDDTNKTIDTV